MEERITGDREVSERAEAPLTPAHPVLAVASIDAAIEHYRTVLGFFLEWARYDDNGGGIANLWRGRLSLLIRTSDEYGPSVVYCHLAGRGEVDALHEDLVQAGATITSPPEDRWWGNYEMEFVDLDENAFRIACAADEGA